MTFWRKLTKKIQCIEISQIWGPLLKEYAMKKCLTLCIFLIKVQCHRAFFQKDLFFKSGCISLTNLHNSIWRLYYCLFSMKLLYQSRNFFAMFPKTSHFRHPWPEIPKSHWIHVWFVTHALDFFLVWGRSPAAIHAERTTGLLHEPQQRGHLLHELERNCTATHVSRDCAHE